MIKNILIAIDYSECSLNALNTAINIAERNSAILHVLHITDVLQSLEGLHKREKSQKIIDIMGGKLLAQHGVQSKVIFAEGIVGHTIVNTIIENKIDLVVMGVYGESGPNDLHIGSNSYYVIKRSSCPVLLIPEGEKKLEFNKILFPVRPTLFSINLYKILEDIIRPNKKSCTIQILSIASNRFDKYLARFLSLVDIIKSSYKEKKIAVLHKHSNNINIPENVLTEADNIMADLIVIAPGVDVASRPSFLGPFSQRIINHSKVPVLSIIKSGKN